MPLDDFDKWCARYDLTPITRKCRGCGVDLTTTVPIATHKSRGLMSEPHSCGPEYNIMTLKVIDQAFGKLLESF